MWKPLNAFHTVFHKHFTSNVFSKTENCKILLQTKILKQESIFNYSSQTFKDVLSNTKLTWA